VALGRNEYYVRPTNGSDVAGQGTSHATAYQTLNFAVSDITSTHGVNAGTRSDRINICDEATAVVTSNVTYTSQLYGRTYEGYTSVAGDGGIGVLNMGTTGGTARYFNSRTYTNFKNLEIFGGLNPLRLSSGTAQNVKIHDTASGCIDLATNAMLIDCEAYNINNFFVTATSGQCTIIGCKFWPGTGSGISGIGIALGFNSRVSRTIVDIGTGTNNAIQCNSSINMIDGCSIVSRGNASTSSHAVRVSSIQTTISNCLIQGWSATGQVAIQTTGSTYNIFSVSNNAFYDNDTDYPTGSVMSASDNENPGASLFVDLASDDYTPANIGNIRNGSYGALNISKGAHQLSAGGAAAAAFHPLAYN